MDRAEIQSVQLGIKVGDIFNTYEEAEFKVNKAAQSNFVRLYKREARTIQAGTRKTNRYLNPALNFYQVEWACVHGGRHFKGQGQGIRQTKTLRKAEPCPAHIRIRVSPSGNDFEVTTVQNNHNHKVSKNFFEELSQRKKFPTKVKIDRAIPLKRKISGQRNNDISAESEPQNKTQHSNQIKEACEKINSKFGCDCHILVGDNNLFNGLMFCTDAMKSTMAAYPEFLCVDRTYKLPNINATVYLLLIVNGNGDCVVVAVSILTTEDRETITWLLENFKGENPMWTKTKTVMINKDLSELDAVTQCFPDAHVQTCIFHALKIFQADVTCHNFKITITEKRTFLEYIQKLVNCRQDSEFSTIVDIMKNKVSSRIFQYFETNWLSVKEQWYLGDRNNNFLDMICNTLDGITTKLRRVIDKDSSIEEFLDELHVILKSVQTKQDSRLTDMLNRRPTVAYKTDILEYKYRTVLTPYGFNMMTEEFNYEEINVTVKNGVYICSDPSDVSYCCITTSKCTCYFHTFTGLPCRHIFATRHLLNLDLFTENLVPKRWQIKYLLENTPSLNSKSHEFNKQSNAETSPGTIGSREQKYEILLEKCKTVARLGAEAQDSDFMKLNNLFDQLVNMLDQNTFNFTFSYKTSYRNRINNRGNIPQHFDEDLIRFEQVVDVQQDANLLYYDDVSNLGANVEIDSSDTVTHFNEHEDLDCGKMVTINNSQGESESEEIGKTNFGLENVEGHSNQDVTVDPPKKRKKDRRCFDNKTSYQKRMVILGWLLCKSDYKKPITIDDLKTVEEIDNRILEIDFSIIKKCIPPELWMAVKNLRQEKLKSSIWSCFSCKNTIFAKEQTIRCDACLHWFHAACTNALKNISENWYCTNCR